MLKLWGMRSTPSMPSLLGPLWPGVETPDRVLYMVQIELFAFEFKLRIYAKLSYLK